MSIASNPALAEQSTLALAELLAGLVAAGDSLAGIDPARLTEGLVAAVLRLGFALHAEARGLVAGPSLRDVAERLHAAQASELAARSDAWTEIQAISRRILGTSASPGGGGLLDPDAYPFLDAPISDAATRRVLGGLCFIEGERVAYEALPIEGLGGLYEALLGITVARTEGLTVALRPDHAIVDLDALLACPPVARVARAEAILLAPLAPRRRRALVAASSIPGLLRVFAGRLSPRTPTPIGAGSWVLASATSRRRSGSHYTPPALTAEVIAAVLAPHLEEARDPEAILALAICDPAMGSGAFLLETARFLGDRLVRARGFDVDVELDPGLDLALALDPTQLAGSAILAARREIAERCLHGVDKDPVAVDLARLSLWMLAGGAGKARDFLGEKLQCGDSLVGARREDLAAYPHAALGRPGPRRREGVSEDLTLAVFNAASREARRRMLDAWTALWLWPDEHAVEMP
ncbi:MAG: N-6 DNA methylase, partial [Byssovorax sp.]